MTAKMLLEYASIVEVVLCIATLVLLLRKGLVRKYPWVTAFLAVHAVSHAINTALLYFRKELGVPHQLAYDIIFYNSWCAAVLESLFSILILYAIYKLAMEPFQGLSRLGTVVFQWAVVACVMVTVGMMIAPHTDLATTTVLAHFQILTQHLDQGINVLTLCLLVFVCFATRVLGLTFRSRMFGITLGLGILAMSGLVEAAWFSTSAGHSVYSPMYAFNACACVVALLVWGAYFATPEQKRQMVLLPTTSPYFLWNRVSEALGDAPGQVAVSGFTPDMLAPAELTALTASSKFARENQQRRDETERERAQVAAREAMNPVPSFSSVAMQG